MTDKEETLLEPTEEFKEIEENEENEEFDEIDGSEDRESIIDDLELEMINEDDIMFEDDEDDGQYEMDIGGLLSSVLATEDGETVCSALVNISRQMEIQNKIFIIFYKTMILKSPPCIVSGNNIIQPFFHIIKQILFQIFFFNKSYFRYRISFTRCN